MKKGITRRSALTAGAAAGMFMGSSVRQSHAQHLQKVWGQEFITPWSPSENMKRNLTPGKTPIRLSCSAYCLHFSKGMDIAKRVKEIRAAGYTAAEANDQWKLATDSEIRELKAILKEHDLLFYTIHRCINNIHPDLTERQKINKQVAENVETAERLNLSFIVTHTGSCNPDGPTLPHRDNWSKETWDISVKALKQIIKDTSGSKVNLAVEALNPCNINNPWAHVKLKEDVGDSRITVTLDPQNMMNTATYYRSTELVNTCFDLLGEDISYAHCKDVLWKPEMLPAFEWVVVGTGTMDYETYLTRLSQLKQTRPLFLEFLPAEKYPQAKKYVEETAAKVGVQIYS
ncbi:MAG: sugar phosphate isomerase/epimerase [Candidatus Latescibacteria bacterium]|nr:sugar phosphate isomerase/epimerase [Candidatus Latescibacterota bacterium]